MFFLDVGLDTIKLVNYNTYISRWCCFLQHVYSTSDYCCNLMHYYVCDCLFTIYILVILSTILSRWTRSNASVSSLNWITVTSLVTSSLQYNIFISFTSPPTYVLHVCTRHRITLQTFSNETETWSRICSRHTIRFTPTLIFIIHQKEMQSIAAAERDIRLWELGTGFNIISF